VFAHFEEAELASRAEAVLGRAKEPQRVVAFSFERENSVDDVLEHAWPGEAAFLGDVPDHDERQVASLGFLHETVRAPAHLHHRSGRRAELGVDDGLDGIDHHEARRDLVDGRDDVRQVRLGQQPQLGRHRTEAVGPQAHLLGALFGGDVEHGPGRAREQLQQKGALADAGLAAEQRDRTGNQSAPEHPVEFVDAGRGGVGCPRVDVADGTGLARRDECEPGGERGTVVGALDVFHERVPRAARQTLARPFRKRRPAFGAAMDELQSCHRGDSRCGVCEAGS
jgi:hypothetical protein